MMTIGSGVWAAGPMQALYRLRYISLSARKYRVSEDLAFPRLPAAFYSNTPLFIQCANSRVGGNTTVDQSDMRGLDTA
ncbi:MAG: hypothetical protein K2P84_01380 [Undibacterium sp.]|nr:hypothetical protein [Undibacterium sp.]